MLKDKVKELLNEMPGDVNSEFFHGEIDDCEISKWDDEEVAEWKNKFTETGITFKMLDRYGGEGGGEDYWSVYSFSDGSEVVLIKFDGYYQSYEGSTFDSFFEVKAVERMVTFYEKK